MSRESSDEELLKIIIAGKDKDNEAIKSIYNKYVGPIYKYIFFHIGDKSEVEDITSEVFIKVIKNIKKIRDTSNSKAWIYRVAKNTISDYWRKHYRYKIIFLDEMSLGIKDDIDNSEKVENKSKNIVKKILSSLPENYRKVLELRILEGKSLKLTAEELNITANNVKVLQHRALKKAASNFYRTGENDD